MPRISSTAYEDLPHRRGATERFDFDQVFDGNTWVIEQGTDYVGPGDALSSAVQVVAPGLRSSLIRPCLLA